MKGTAEKLACACGGNGWQVIPVGDGLLEIVKGNVCTCNNHLVKVVKEGVDGMERGRGLGVEKRRQEKVDKDMV